MNRFVKFIGILIVIGIVSFLICDEKGVKINSEDGHMVFEKEEKWNPVYENSKLITFYSGFGDNNILLSGTIKTYSNNTKYVSFYKGFNDNKILRKSAGIKTGIQAILSSTSSENDNLTSTGNIENKSDSNRLIKVDNSTLSDILAQNQQITRAVKSYEVASHKMSISSAIEPEDIPQEYIGYIPDTIHQDIKPESGEVIIGIDTSEYTGYIPDTIHQDIKPESGEVVVGIDTSEYTGYMEDIIINSEHENQSDTGIQLQIDTGNDIQQPIENVGEYIDYELLQNTENTSGGIISSSGSENSTVSVKRYTASHPSYILTYGTKIQIPTRSVKKSEFQTNEINLGYGVEKEIITVSVIPFVDRQHYIQLKKGIYIEPIISAEIQNVDNTENRNQISSSELEQLLIDDEIDINSLESENDEVLQKIFAKNQDPEVMNLIVENYLNEYQFTKAKKFIESLSESSYLELDPLLNLRVSFNSFSLTSQTIITTLTQLVNSYKNQISSDDLNRYLGVIALMQKNYDQFFEISNNFQSEKHKNFSTKIQSLIDQTSKEMGIPDYYLDTLVALELFNQGLFQPSKVIAISSLSQNSNYILPYQILGYANFLTNSWDTAIEYFKKLIDLDPNNAEKYRFLMGVAYYRGEKYEQSVVMLSMINEGKLRLDAERYLIRNYIILDQKNKLISSRGKLLGYDNLTASDFYTYFNEAFYRPYAEGSEYTIYAYDAGLGDKMIKVCQLTLPEEERVVCGYGSLGKEIALGNFEGLEQSLLSLVGKYPQSYLYHALGEYYIKNGDNETAKTYLLKAVSLTQTKGEKSQIKKLLEGTM